MQFKETWQAVLAGRKTQTRRLVKDGEWAANSRGYAIEWPHGQGGGPIDAVLTGLIRHRVKWQVGRTIAVVPGRGRPAVWVRADGSGTDAPLDEYVRRARPVDAPRWGSKVKRWLTDHGYHELRIRITAIRHEHLGDISEADAIAEGCRAYNDYETARREFTYLWDSVHDPEAWERDKEKDVWVLEFERVD